MPADMHTVMMLVFAAGVTALPLETSSPTLCNTFSTQMTVMSDVLTLKAVANGTNPGLIVLGQHSTLTGSTVVLKGETPDASLSFDIDGELYGWVVGDIGHVAGAVIPVGAEKGYEEYAFTVAGDGAIYHRPTAATNFWMACSRTVNGEQGTVLSWGNTGGDGGFPMGCGYTKVERVCLNNTAITYGG